MPVVPTRPAARRAWPALLLAFLVLIAGGCSPGGQEAAEASVPTSPVSTASVEISEPASPTVTTVPASPSVLATAAVPATPAAQATPTAAPATPVALRSPWYRYSLVLPAGWSTRDALEAWDGSSRVDSDGPYVDRALGPGSKLFFVYGAPTALELPAYAGEGQADVAEWHRCPATAESETDIEVGGVPGRLHAFHCQGLHVMKAFVVRDGFGWAFNQIGPPGDEAADVEGLRALLAEVRWTE